MSPRSAAGSALSGSWNAHHPERWPTHQDPRRASSHQTLEHRPPRTVVTPPRSAASRRARSRTAHQHSDGGHVTKIGSWLSQVGILERSPPRTVVTLPRSAATATSGEIMERPPPQPVAESPRSAGSARRVESWNGCRVGGGQGAKIGGLGTDLGTAATPDSAFRAGLIGQGHRPVGPPRRILERLPRRQWPRHQHRRLGRRSWNGCRSGRCIPGGASQAGADRPRSPAGPAHTANHGTAAASDGGRAAMTWRPGPAGRSLGMRPRNGGWLVAIWCSGRVHRGPRLQRPVGVRCGVVLAG